MCRPPSRVLLLGAGRFGQHHLTTWKRLSQAGECHFVGVVVRSDATRTAVEQRHDVPAFTALTNELLESVDAVDIVTPPDTHVKLVTRCLRSAHVLVEKPLAPTEPECRDLVARAAEHNRVLMVGHIYRHHPLVMRLAELVAAIPETPRAIRGVMLNPDADRLDRADPSLEFLHLFDIIDLLFGESPEVCVSSDRGNARLVSLRYPRAMNAFLTIGWQSARRARQLRLEYSDRTIHCDFIESSLVVARRNHQVDKEFLGHQHVALDNELRAFLGAIRSEVPPQADGDTATRIVRIAARTIPPPPSGRFARPRVAVLGAGVFGATCAAELAEFCDVTVIERRPALMTEVSFVNQWRHHSGFHYPRSYDQIQEIRAARESFEQVYGAAVSRSHPSYFCTSATGVEIPASRYLAACKSNELSYTLDFPPDTVLDHRTVTLSVLSDEGVYDFERLRAIAADRLRASPSVNLLLNAEAVGGALLPGGEKRIAIRTPQGTEEHDFDFVVNATYANRNLLASWFRFPIEPLRFDLYEMLVLRLDIEPICVTIMDGPFTSLVTMGYDNLFMLSHINDSVHKSLITESGLPPDWGPVRSNRDNMIAHAGVYLPILRRAEIVESRFATRAVNAFAKDFDARPTVVAAEGFGCWSILGGKIITCVQDTRRIADAIRAEVESAAI